MPPLPLIMVLATALSAIARDSAVVFNEVHYHPAGDDSTLEYVELYNQLAVDVDVSNWRIDGDIQFDFPEGTVIGGREYLVVARNPGALAAATGFAGALGPYSDFLSNSGNPVRLYNNNRSFRSQPGGTGSVGSATAGLEARRIMDELDYSDTYPWPVGPDGSGFTLAKRNRATGTAQAENWAVGGPRNGTPGSLNTFPTLPSVAINEVAATGDADFQIELHNHGGADVALGGMVIASSDPAHANYTFPANSLAPGAFSTVTATSLGFTPADNNRLFLYTAGKLTLVDAVRADDRAKARMPEGTGRWLRPDGPTFGAANSFDIADSLVINEIFYHAYPQRGTPGTPPGFVDLEVLDYASVWRHNLDAGPSGLPSGWATVAHAVDNISWAQGPGLLGKENSALGEPIRTNITLSSKIPYYFETEFTYNDPGEVAEMVIEHYLDDGAVFYLNGAEIARFNMPEGAFSPGTLASPGVSNAALRTLTITNPNILQGSNRLSVEIHQTSLGSSDLVLGARVTLRQPDGTGSPGITYTERDEEWLELYNRGTATVDLTGWKLAGGIGYSFPATTIPAGGYLVIAKDASALAAKHPGARVIGDYAKPLGNGGDLIVLEDPVGNPADEVRYHDSGMWHAVADGGGSSLELRDPDADNRTAGAWAPSDESARNNWQTYTYEGVAVNDGIGNNAYHEFLLGLLDAGEFLLDDVSVLENNSIEFIQNGDFQSDAPGTAAATWRAIGTHGSHGRTVVVTDPDDAGNKCLHVVATGPTEDKHNKLETTFAGGEIVVAGNNYRISFRAKFLSGSNQVNTRLYFNYLQRTTKLGVSGIWGTPGLPNTAAVANAGPTFSGLSHAPVVPDAGQSVTVRIDAADPDGVADLTLFFSVDGGSFQSTSMSGADGAFTGTIPGQSAGRIVRFHVRGRDSSNATTFHPAAGPDSGAFYKVQDGYADNSGLRHNFRIIMAESDRQFLFLNTNRMSNDRFPVTVIEDEQTVYYDVALRLKASAWGRTHSDLYGFNIRFQPGRLFRGVHETISIERASDLKEILAKHLLNRAGGGYWSFYDDVAHIITPTSGDRGVGLLSMARHTSTFFEGLFPDADEPGTLFNHELLYSPNGTTGGPEDLKNPRPYNHDNGRYDLLDRGSEKEPYRWGFQIRSARGRDDYSKIVALNQALGNLSGTALRNALDPIIDADQWMRTFAMASLNGTDDVIGRVWEHNFRYYVRPTDQKIIVFQWDLDRAFQLGISSSVTPTRNTVVKLFGIPQYRRLFDGHLKDLIETTANSTYAAPWAAHFRTLTGCSNATSYINDRANYVQGTLPGALAFQITTNGGNNFSEADSLADLAGDGWVDVFSIEVNGIARPVIWTDPDSWQLTIPIAPGPNPLALTAYNRRGTSVGSDTITVTNTSAIDLAGPQNIAISELHYHPASPNAQEISAGFTDQDWFEFVELTNVSGLQVDLTGSRFTDGIEFEFPAGTILAPGERLVIVSERTAFEFRYGLGAASIAGQYTGHLRNSGEHILYQAADSSPIADFTYGDALPWPDGADGTGYSLVLAGQDPGIPLDWRMSTTIDGNPGTTDTLPFSGTPDDLFTYALATDPSAGFVADALTASFEQNLAADDALTGVEFSPDLVTWTPASPEQLLSLTNNGNGTVTHVWKDTEPASSSPRRFVRIRIELR